MHRGACLKTWRPEFNTQITQGGRRETLTSTSVPWYGCACTHTHMYIHMHKISALNHCLQTTIRYHKIITYESECHWLASKGSVKLEWPSARVQGHVEKKYLVWWQFQESKAVLGGHYKRIKPFICPMPSFPSAHISQEFRILELSWMFPTLWLLPNVLFLCSLPWSYSIHWRQNSEEWCLSFYCSAKTPWPKANWGGNSLFNLTTPDHRPPSIEEAGRNLGWNVADWLAPVTGSACFLVQLRTT